MFIKKIGNIFKIIFNLIKNILAQIVNFNTYGKNNNSIKKEKTLRAFRQKDQIELITKNNFSTKQIMNKQEFNLFLKIEKLLKDNHQKYRVFPQVSLGEIFTSNNQEAFKCINSKRTDFIIINYFGHPIIMIEYQGSGHHIDSDGNSYNRDTVKRAICHKTGITYLEFFENYDDDDINRIRKIINNIENIK